MDVQKQHLKVFKSVFKKNIHNVTQTASIICLQSMVQK